MKKEYQKPEAKVIVFAPEELLMTSGISGDISAGGKPGSGNNTNGTLDLKFGD